MVSTRTKILVGKQTTSTFKAESINDGILSAENSDSTVSDVMNDCWCRSMELPSGYDALSVLSGMEAMVLQYGTSGSQLESGNTLFSVFMFEAAPRARLTVHGNRIRGP